MIRKIIPLVLVVLLLSITPSTYVSARTTKLVGDNYVVVENDSGTNRITSQLPSGTVASDLLSCLSKDALKEDPQLPATYAKAATCMNTTEKYLALQSRKGDADNSVLALDDLIVSQKSSLREVGVLEDTGPFPELLMSSVPYVTEENFSGIESIAPKCLALGGDNPKPAQIGELNPKLSTGELINSPTKKFTDALYELNKLAKEWLGESDTDKKGEIETKVADLLGASQSLTLVNSPRGLDRLNPKVVRAMRENGLVMGIGYNANVTCTGTPFRDFAVGASKSYTLTALGISTTQCFPFDIVKNRLIAHIKSKIDELSAIRSKMLKISVKAKNEIDKLLRQNSSCNIAPISAPPQDTPTPTSIPVSNVGESNSSPVIHTQLSPLESSEPVSSMNQSGQSHAGLFASVFYSIGDFINAMFGK